MAERIPAGLTSSDEGRKFGLTVGGAFLVFAAIAWWRGHPSAASALGALGGTLALLGITIPARLGPLNRAWMGLAHMISKVTTPVFMGVVFFLAVTPIGLLLRAFGKRPMQSPPGASSYWKVRAPSARRSDLSRQF